ncbi:hypothetical protein L596_009295 [Steinernema carpocapsae]|uniref:Sas10 C-terminal domain-containing protein n=1 Tax=Steinernema carpocapsae TaxID=34508 RepID=A0A4U5PEX7_STECR|nr:hypothetical protein L596_009295 [Steinernema carpocapsae]
MGKRRGGQKQHKKLQHERKATADGNESDEIYDEVDRFNNDRNAISMDLTRRSKRPAVEEVLNVEGDDYSDDQEEVDGDFDDSDADDSDEEAEEADSLPNTNTWGKKRAEFYGSSYVDEDWGGVNASDEEAIDLEEEDALARQKKLDAALASIDYGDVEVQDGQDEEMEEDKEEENESSPEKLLVLFQAHRPEYESMVEEYKDKKALMKSTIAPIKKLIEAMGDEDFPLREELQAVVFLFASYFSCLLFYVHYVQSLPVEELGEVSKHPVIEQLMKLKKYLGEAENLIDFNERQFRKVCSAIEDGKQKTALKMLARIAGKLPAKPDRSAMKVGVVEDEFAEGNEEATGAGEEVVDGNEKRKITKEIEKNRGLTAKRKKNRKHSRIQKRVQFGKAVIKRRSQVPDVRREVDKYGGEARGIRASKVRSIKLKA